MHAIFHIFIAFAHKNTCNERQPLENVVDDHRDDDGPNQDTREQKYGIRNGFQDTVKHVSSPLLFFSIALTGLALRFFPSLR